MFGPEGSRWVSSSSGKKRPVRRMAIGEPVLAMRSAAKLLGRELGDAVDVARRRRSEFLVEPDRRVAPRAAGADRLGDHQRGRRGEDEAVVARRDRRFEQVARAVDIDLDERPAPDSGRCPACAARRRGSPPRCHARRRSARPAPDRRPSRPPRVSGPGATSRPDDLMPRLAQARREEAAEPAGGAGQQDAHGLRRRSAPSSWPRPPRRSHPAPARSA